MKKYLIIGGSIAGVSCVEGIRSLDKEGQITLVTAEPFSNYGRPLISYYLEGKTDIPRMSWRGEDFFEKNNVDVRHAVTAEKLEPEAGKAILSTGEALSYDALCLCTGSYPFSPRFEGLETVPQRFFFTTLSDALALEQAVTSTSKPTSFPLFIRAVFPSKRVTVSPSISLSPLASRCLSRMGAQSASRLALMACSAKSQTVTLPARSRRPSAHFRPMKPAPTMSTRLSFVTVFSRARASARVVKKKRLSTVSSPSKRGEKGWEPRQRQSAS